MIGLAVLAGVAIYIGVFWFIFRALKQKWAKGLAVFVALGIPFWDLPFGYYNFHSHCMTEGGIQQYAPISPQKSLFFPQATGVRPEQLFNLGVEVVEFRSPKRNSFLRYTRSDRGIEKHETAESTSAVRIVTNYNFELPW